MGSSGTGSLLVNGGLVTSGAGYIGFNFTSVGSATVSSGTWSNSNELFVGYSGTGSLNLTDTGVVSVGAGTGTVGITDESGSVGTLNIGTGGAAGTLNAAVVNGGSGVAIVNFNHTGTTTFAAELTGSIRINKQGSGTTLLTGNNSFTGAVTVEDGSLFIMGDNSSAANFLVESGATLGGTGTLSNVTVSGTLAPGSSLGLLSIEGDLSMNAGSTLVMQFNGTAPGAFDQLAVGGLFAANGTLYLDVGYAATWGDTFTIFTNGGWDSGDFIVASNLNGGLEWNTDQLGTLGIISVIPEPSTLGLLGLGVLSILALRRRRLSA